MEDAETGNAPRIQRPPDASRGTAHESQPVLERTTLRRLVRPNRPIPQASVLGCPQAGRKRRWSFECHNASCGKLL
jgi:hypothetical protein